ncbi:MAG: hypothetical protein VCA74_00905 [Deltaproteobacteria bacterium]
MLENVKTWMRQLTEVGILLVALAVVLQILFGQAIPFIGGDVVANITALVGSLGDSGLVGLISLGIIMYILQRRTGVSVG